MIRRAIDRLGLRLARTIRSPSLETERTEVYFHSAAGYRIAATLIRPTQAGPWPGVVLCPGADHDQRAFETRASPVRASEVAALGCAVLIYDPSGRGNSWGPEDYGGPEHQDNAACAVTWLRAHESVDESQVGMIGISLGVASAVGGARLLAARGEAVRWVIDWEGPCDQRTITANQTMNAPAMGHKATDRTYWTPREALVHLPHIACGYHRLQAHPDHAQPEELGHAIRMLETAVQSNLPWFRINDSPQGQVPNPPRWLPPGPLAANRAILRALQAALSQQ